jgi:hypothetical protein
MKEYIIKVDENKKDIMGNMPLIDKPQELVRCKDCVAGIKVKNGAGEDAIMCDIDLEPHCYPLDWFCADGERANT